jgi:hypothetical protein
MARKKNKGYGLFAGFMRVIRNRFAADPMGKVKETGLTGEVIGRVGDNLLEKPIKNASFALTSLTYQKGVDTPAKGSATYTAWYLAISKVVHLIITFMAITFFIAFLKADVLSQIKFVAATIPLLFLILGIRTVVGKAKKALGINSKRRRNKYDQH